MPFASRLAACPREIVPLTARKTPSRMAATKSATAALPRAFMARLHHARSILQAVFRRSYSTDRLPSQRLKPSFFGKNISHSYAGVIGNVRFPFRFLQNNHAVFLWGVTWGIYFVALYFRRVPSPSFPLPGGPAFRLTLLFRRGATAKASQAQAKLVKAQKSSPGSPGAPYRRPGQ